MKLSKVFGKKILSASGERGYVVSAGLSDGEICFLCADVNEKEFFVGWKNVVKSGENIVYDGAGAARINFCPLRLGRACFDFRGKFLGKLEDCTLSGGKLKTAKIGKKIYPAEGLILGDVVLVKDLRRLNCDVVKDGKTLFCKGVYVTDEILGEAAAAGEYVQTTLKSI